MLQACTDLIARFDASAVSRPTHNGGQHHQLAIGGISCDEQSHALHLAVRAHTEVGVLPVTAQANESPSHAL